MKKVIIVGGGLSGSEAAYQCIKRGIPVELHEMRPMVMTKAHKSGSLSELVCSNSFRGKDLTNAVGLLKEELKLWDSLIMKCALASEVPAGGALAVDRERFSQSVDSEIRNHPLVTIKEGELKEIPESDSDSAVIIATGPLTSKSLSEAIMKYTGNSHLSFFDAISPIILYDSIDQSIIFRQSRYDKGDGADYLNIPLSKEEYIKFIEDVVGAEKFGGHEEVESDMVSDLRPFEGCMPIEDMAVRGIDTLRHGPLKPMGLTDPRFGKRPYAVIQLRQDNLEGTLWSMVGFQTRMKHPEQLRVFKTIPGLQEAEFVRLGSVHRNTFIDSPKCLNSSLEFRKKTGLFFAGQLTGTEGYVESTAGGLLAGINASLFLSGKELFHPPTNTALGGLMNYISDPTREYFQPMNISFGLIPAYSTEPREGQKKFDKKERRREVSAEALRVTAELASVYA
jgi:methylenetetrahydrofolate--tRNA-(uracil-5-)-methyltransferase